MKILITPSKNVLLLLITIMQVCYSLRAVEPLNFIEIGEITDILSANQDLWISVIRDRIMTYMGNRDITEVIISMNEDIQSIFKNMSDKLEENIQSYQLLIGQIDDYYTAMVVYHENHEKLFNDTKKMMVNRCYKTLKYFDSDGLVKLVNAANNFIASKNFNFLDALNQIPQVRITRLKKYIF